MRTLELFSGMGGMATGLELAGFEHACLVEFNRHACASLRQNFSSMKVYEGDVREFDSKKIGSVDLVAGGPPCQPFSLGGKHLGSGDSRDMFPQAIRIIEELQPKFFIFENVKGLLRESFSNYFSYIVERLTYPEIAIKPSQGWLEHLQELKTLKFKDFQGLKYRVAFKLVNSADYGVPQTRERVIIVGIRSDLDFDWSFPPKTHSKERLQWDQHVSHDYWKRNGFTTPPSNMVDLNLARKLSQQFGLFEPDLKPWATIREALQGVADPREEHHIKDHVFKDGAKVYPGHTGSPFDSPSKTIKAGGHGVPGGENMIAFPDGSVRYLTVFEAKRIQTFPDSYIVEGAWGEAMRQIGNAVPVKLAEILGKHLLKLYQESATQRLARIQ